MDNCAISLNGKLRTTPLIMGIINITPDSFFESCRNMTEKEVLSAAEKALTDGADILDIGGYSTRPGAPEVSTEEELQRLCFALSCIRRQFPDALLSVDTYRAKIAAHVVREFGVSIINDISGGTLDADMFETVAKLQVAYVLMHMRGTPQNMSQQTDYENMMADIMDFFQQRIFRLKELGVKDIILDPGFGFAKTLEQNYELLQKLSYFRVFNLPILAGLSRKSMIYRLLDKQPQDALNGTSVLNTIALMNGAGILRVHDVKEAMETVILTQKVQQEYMTQTK